MGARIFLVITFSIFTSVLIAACSENNSKPLNLLQRVQKQGQLIILTRNSPTTYYQGPRGKMGLEYELAKRFAKYLGVRLKVIVPDRFKDILPMLVRGEAHIAAAGLTVTKKRKKLVKFGPPYQHITQQLVYRLGTKKPRNLSELNGNLEVVAGSSHIERLKQLTDEYPALKWKANKKSDSDELLYLVWQQLIEYTIADSNEVALNRRYYPELRVAFDLTKPQQLAWAFRYSDDDSLYNAAVAFFRKLDDNGVLEQLRERYYGHVRNFDYINTRLYLRHIKTRLPRYRKLFEDAAKQQNLDWRLLAAIGYQESHWDPKARSHTGVRGIMMLTLTTARQLNIRNRIKPENSIYGGARYLRYIIDNAPDDLKEPDKTWMALASYNVGRGHLQDARKLTRRRGGDPDKWVDVKKTLPLLSIRKWYRKTRHGYARGREPVLYVERIRSYYDLLVWVTNKEKSYTNTPRQKLKKLDSPVM
jgi:membrane-bound lytic murein transglycosylase F